MKDPTSPPLPPAQQIPLVSPVLHYFAMPAIVVWRHSFGYSYLRPKSVFLSSAIASVLLSYIVFHETGLRRAFGGLAGIALLVSILYGFHLCRSVTSELARSAQHDKFSGSSYLLNFWPKSQRIHQERFLHTVAEPTLTMLVGMGASFLGKGWLGCFILLSGAALFVKEAINGWLTLRRRKAFEDQIGDIADEMPEATPQHEPASTNAASRKQRVKRERKTVTAEFNAEEFRHAQVLRLIPPYTLDAATANYRLLIQQVHPDRFNKNVDAHRLAADLNAAMEFFRSRF